MVPKGRCISHGLPSTTDNAECSTSVSDKSGKKYNLVDIQITSDTLKIEPNTIVICY